MSFLTDLIYTGEGRTLKGLFLLMSANKKVSTVAMVARVK